MPRKSRIDAAGALHHIIARGIDRSKIFQDPTDKRNFLKRPAEILVEKGIALGKRDDLIGGGLIRSHGGWANVKAMRRAKIIEKADERILGDGDFVQEVLARAEEKLKRRYDLQAKGVSLERVTERVAELFNTPSSELWLPGKHRQRVRAKSLLCHWANRELGISMAKLSRRMNVSVMAVSYAVQRGEKIAREFNFSL